jgi:essential nuclear protein 1
LGCTRRNILKNNGSALDYPIFKAIEKAVQTNPTLFFRGFLFPLCESNQCSVKEACLISSILGQSTSISSAHTTSALIALAETPYYTVSTSVFILAFIEKKHVVPFRAIESLTCHFYSMIEEKREAPRVWYESLYAFVKW